MIRFLRAAGLAVVGVIKDIRGIAVWLASIPGNALQTAAWFGHPRHPVFILFCCWGFFYEGAKMRLRRWWRGYGPKDPQ